MTAVADLVPTEVGAEGAPVVALDHQPANAPDTATCTALVGVLLPVTSAKAVVLTRSTS